jgi:hypothetical protein
VLPTTKIVKYSDVTHTISSEHALDAARERIEGALYPGLFNYCGEPNEVTGVPDYQSGRRQHNGFANPASFD